jgi:hypothetical protein
VDINAFSAFVTLSEKDFLEPEVRIPTLSENQDTIIGGNQVFKQTKIFDLSWYFNSILSRYGVGIKYALSKLAKQSSLMKAITVPSKPGGYQWEFQWRKVYLKQHFHIDFVGTRRLECSCYTNNIQW